MTQAKPAVLTYQTKIVRENRLKTARLQVHDGFVSINVPKTFSDDQIDQLLFEHDAWIQTQLQQQCQTIATPDRSLQNGEAFPYLGRNYRLRISLGSTASVQLVQGRLQIVNPSLDDQILRQLLTDWYQQQAKLRLSAKTARFAKILGVLPGSIRIRTLRSGWSNLSASGELRFHWKIIMAPHSIINYVVVHALCQLKYPQLNADFWQALDGLITDAQACRDWLDNIGSQLDL